MVITQRFSEKAHRMLYTTELICVKIMVSTTTVRDIHISVPEAKEEEEKDGENREFTRINMDCLLGCLATLSILVVRVVLLEYSKIHEKTYTFIVCELEAFKCIT